MPSADPAVGGVIAVAYRKVLMEAMFHTQRQIRWLYLLLSVVLLLCLGLIYAWSIFRVPLENEFGWSKAETSITFSISMMMFCLGGVVSGVLTERRGVRTTLILCAVLLAAGFVSASGIHSLWGMPHMAAWLAWVPVWDIMRLSVLLSNGSRIGRDLYPAYR